MSIGTTEVATSGSAVNFVKGRYCSRFPEVNGFCTRPAPQVTTVWNVDDFELPSLIRLLSCSVLSFNMIQLFSPTQINLSPTSLYGVARKCTHL